MDILARRKANIELSKQLAILGNFYKPVFLDKMRFTNNREHISDHFRVIFNKKKEVYEFEILQNELPELIAICKGLFYAYMSDYI